jgi:HAD superfamily hydrolase (TIGR01509 family)
VNSDTRLERILVPARGVVFDFDNIIVDSEPYHFEAYRRVFERHGHRLDPDEYWLEWTSRGGGAEGEIERHNLGLDPDDIRREKDPIYSDFCRNEIALFPEARGIVEILHEAGFLLAVASGSYSHDIRTILTTAGIESLFGSIVGKDGVQRYKPYPDTFLTASRLIGVPPGECVAVEDAEKGILSAREAGMPVILVDTPVTKGLAIGGADMSFPGLREFFETLQRVLPALGRRQI